MGLFLLLVLSCFFGFILSENARKEKEQLQCKVTELEKELVKLKESHEFEKRIWKNTVRELL